MNLSDVKLNITTKLVGKGRESLTASLTVIGHVSVYFQLHSTTRSRRNFSGYVPSAPSPSTLPRLPLIKNISPMRPGWIGNKHANSKRGICFPKKIQLPLSSERWSQSFTTSSARRVQRIGPLRLLPRGQRQGASKIFFSKAVWK